MNFQILYNPVHSNLLNKKKKDNFTVLDNADINIRNKIYYFKHKLMFLIYNKYKMCKFDII